MPVLEQIMPTSNNLHISTGKELTISDLDMKTGKGENKIYIAQNKWREEKKGNKRLLNLDAIECLKVYIQKRIVIAQRFMIVTLCTAQSVRSVHKADFV